MPLAELFHIAFYRYVAIADVASIATVLRHSARTLLGNLLVAPEGINGALAGAAADLDEFERALGGDSRLGGAFEGMRFARTPCRTAPFQRLKVHGRKELLSLGLPARDSTPGRGTQLDAIAWRAMLDAGNVVVIDNRNGFEHRLGRFRNAIDPEVRNFRDLPRFVEARAADWKERAQPVAMYCTGGIRCERTAAWMRDAFDIEVLQLEGGILRYLADAPADDQAWQGECFVFDNRIALDARLEQGVSTAADAYADEPDQEWRMRRARRLSGDAH